MPKMNMTVPHELERDEVERRLKGLLGKIKEKHGDKFSNFTEEWAESQGTFSFTTYGFNVKTTVIAEEQHVKLDADLPFAAMMFKGKIEQEVRETLTRVLTSEQRAADEETT